MAGSLPSLSMSQTKDDLLKHLNLPAETYSLMAKEADHVYKWLTQEKRHLKKNCKRKPPYDWSDINEKSKDEAMQRIAQSGDQYTAYYWNLAAPTDDCPNWIARWFLYHKFRYRDGRNRNPAKSDEGALSSHHHSSKKSRSGQSTDVESSEDYYDPQGSYYNTSSMTSSSDSQNYYTSADGMLTCRDQHHRLQVILGTTQASTVTTQKETKTTETKIQTRRRAITILSETPGRNHNRGSGNGKVAMEEYRDKAKP
ncbi:hypothetical protein G7Y89_g3483 [Cudoniella acicularis]|uniref:Uncharacterized protein n=1 Tax=Cudoniella acicularis TaxID=354080 RepID=A0A8H4RT57_9HELO|nr:hypothetical protein G7Y89_g3483 [Cudoniella acicularis]